MGLKSKFRQWFFLEDDEYEDVDDSFQSSQIERNSNNERVHTSRPSQNNVVSLQSLKQTAKLILVEPRVYAEAQDIADHLKNRRAVVVNLQRIDHHEARRIIDFLSGTVYAIGGDFQKIGADIFLCAPDNVEISGNISSLMNSEINDSRW